MRKLRISNRDLRRRTNQGSTFLIVLSVLTVLVLLAATFTFTTRLEVRAADNFSDAIQSRFAALSGLPAAASAILERPGLAVAANQRWSHTKGATPAVTASALARPVSAQSTDPVRLRWAHSLQSQITIEDEGGKIALNSLSLEKDPEPEAAIGIQQFGVADLEGVIERLAEDQALEGVDAKALSQSIIAYLNRKQKDATKAEPPAASDSQDSSGAVFASTRKRPAPPAEDEIESEAVEKKISPYGILAADPRFDLTGEEIPAHILHIEELAKLEGMPKEKEKTRQVVAALATVLTPYSQCRLAFEIDGEAKNALDPNEASTTEIFAALHQMYPDADEKRLKQWAVNLVDWRDNDSIPTVYPGADTEDPILGWERTPYINEVWPDSLSEEMDGDEGEYVEIYNPYNESIDLNGWTLVVESMNSSFQLNGAIAPKGFIVITDDRDNAGDPTPEIDQDPGTGSFYDIFGRIGDGAGRRIIQHSLLNLPNHTGRLVLRDGDGNLIDRFYYTGMARNGVRSSAQRTDPRIRTTQVRPCTPLEPNAGENLDGKDFAAALDRDRPVKSTAELFRIPAYMPDALNEDLPGGYHPRLKDSSVGLDVRLVDLFALGGELQPQAIKIAKNHTANLDEESAEASAAGAERRQAQDEGRIIESDSSETTAALRIASGRININTAPRAVLLALPSMTEELADAILSWRGEDIAEEDESRQASSRAGSKAPFESISDFLANDTVWAAATEENRLAFYRNFANLITVNSQVFQVDAQNRIPQVKNGLRPSQSRNRVYVLVDSKGNPNVLSWRYLY